MYERSINVLKNLDQIYGKEETEANQTGGRVAGFSLAGQ